MKRWFGLTLSVALLATAWLAAAPSGTPVADAAMRGDRDGVRTLLKQGADVGASQEQGDGHQAHHRDDDRHDVVRAEDLLSDGDVDAQGGPVAAVTVAADEHLLVPESGDDKRTDGVHLGEADRGDRQDQAR